LTAYFFMTTPLQYGEFFNTPTSTTSMPVVGSIYWSDQHIVACSNESSYAKLLQRDQTVPKRPTYRGNTTLL
jgi:hypothetical protein